MNAEIALDITEQVIAVARINGSPVLESHALITHARALHATGGEPRTNTIEADLTMALRLARRTGAKILEPRIHDERNRQG